MSVCLSRTPTGDLARNQDVCPGWKSNPWPFDLQAGTQSTEAHQQGQNFLKKRNFIYLVKSVLCFPTPCTINSQPRCCCSWENPSLLTSSRKVLKIREKTLHCKTRKCSHKERPLYDILIGINVARLNINGGSSEEDNILNNWIGRLLNNKISLKG